jgi:ribonuclease P protein component
VTPPGETRTDQRFPRAERLKLRRDYQRVYESGVFFPGTLLVLYVLRDPALTRRAGIVAGRKVGDAVRRNRAKRLLREAFRRNKERIPATGLHLVLVARRGCGEAGYAEVEQDLRALLARARLTAGGNA